jgi:putative redox protein
MRAGRFTFTGPRGQKLAARLELPKEEPLACALFAHCFTCSKDLRSMHWISGALAERGLGVLRFDFSGIGESEGDFAETNFSTNVEEVVAAADWMRRELKAPRLLMGHSLGGAAVLAAAHRIPESAAVATIGTPGDTRHLRKLLLSRAPDIETKGEAQVALGPRAFRIRKQALDDLGAHDLRRAIAGLGKALLVMHSPVDDTVGIEHARLIFEAARHPKSFISLDRADHLLLSNEADARYVAEMLAAWARRYILPAGGRATVRRAAEAR